MIKIMRVEEVRGGLIRTHRISNGPSYNQRFSLVTEVKFPDGGACQIHYRGRAGLIGKLLALVGAKRCRDLLREGAAKEQLEQDWLLRFCGKVI